MLNTVSARPTVPNEFRVHFLCTKFVGAKQCVGTTRGLSRFAFSFPPPPSRCRTNRCQVFVHSPRTVSNRAALTPAWSSWIATRNRCWPCRVPVRQPCCNRPCPSTCPGCTSWTRRRPRSAACRAAGSLGVVTRARTVSRSPCHPTGR